MPAITSIRSNNLAIGCDKLTRGNSDDLISSQVSQVPALELGY